MVDSRYESPDVQSISAFRIMPSVHGEDAVIRILDKEQINESFRDLNLDVVGFAEEDIVDSDASSKSHTEWCWSRDKRDPVRRLPFTAR